MRPEGRLIGQLVNPRDGRGWKIPKEGTIRRGVYNGLVLGLSAQEIATGLRISRKAVLAHKASIVNWKRFNEWRRIG